MPLKLLCETFPLETHASVIKVVLISSINNLTMIIPNVNKEMAVTQPSTIAVNKYEHDDLLIAMH